ncbi:MAG: dienelactone hydrolase family protein [Candidatus Acidiferrales bacterium]|jgi:dienelactone hydrolase|nr:dienelactone hydrolase family protein [Candidatus Acidoferrales bacterium]
MKNDTLPEARRPGRPEVVLYHSAYGLRPGVLQWAERLRQCGYTVHTPDLYDGEVFSDRMDAVRKIQELGFDGMLARSQAAVSHLRNDLVYAGFSNGGAYAELLAATRPGARGAILMHAPLPIRDLGWTKWPGTVPVQVHFADKDPLRNEKVIEALAERVRAGDATFEQHIYAAPGHLFADPDMPAYDAAAAALMFQRVLEFLGSR